MKKLLLILVVILLGVAPIYATKVNTISLTHKANTTIATIYVDGQIRVAHQTEVPKEGRGHRVIIDLLAADHNLGLNIFEELPDCIIKSIRSSQFAVTPERITRVVFDIDQLPLYRIETDQSSVTIYFTDKKARSFAAWNSKKNLSKQKANKPAVVVSAKTKTNSKKPILATKVKATPKETKLAVTKPRPNVTSPKVVNHKTKTVEKPKPIRNPKTIWQDQNHDAEMFAMAQRVSNNPALNGNSWVDRQEKAQNSQPKAVTQKPDVKPAPPKVAPVVAKADQSVKKNVNQIPKPVTTVAKVSKPKPKAKTVKKSSERRPVVVVASAKTNAPETSLTVQGPSTMPLKSEMKPVEQAKTKPNKQAGQKALANKISKGNNQKATTVAQTKPKAKKNISTSRFRRNAGQIGIKGTMVVEFPKRLVIKYKGSKNRDPFETLINANRTTNNPIEKRVPNIDGLRLVGVIESDHKNDRALFEDTDGFGYILKSGDKVRNGYVLRVETDRVYFQIFEYGWSRTVALQLED